MGVMRLSAGENVVDRVVDIRLAYYVCPSQWHGLYHCLKSYLVTTSAHPSGHPPPPPTLLSLSLLF